MSKHCHTVTGISLADNVIPAYSPVFVGTKIEASGFDDDFCFSLYAYPSSEFALPGVTTCEIYPRMAGKVVVSGLAIADLPEFFSAGDQIKPDGHGGWEIDDAGSVQVVTNTSLNKYAVVMLGSRRAAAPRGYTGSFSVKDISSKDCLKVLISGGSTDIGEIRDQELEISESVPVYLLAEYIRDDENSGHYQLKFTTDPEDSITSQEHAAVKLAYVYVKTKKPDILYLEISQEWQNGSIFFGDRYWI